MSVEVLSLYKELLRYSTRFAGYNVRQYAIRRVRDGFLANRSISDPVDVKAALKDGYEQLDILRRQANISQMYKGEKLVVETSRR